MFCSIHFERIFKALKKKYLLVTAIIDVNIVAVRSESILKERRNLLKK